MLQERHTKPPAPAHASATPAPELPARDERTVTLFMLGRLWHQKIDTICRIRNISRGGMRLETSVPLNVGDPVSLETRSGSHLDAQFVWSRDGAVGVRFSGTVEQGELLATPTGRSGKALFVRGPRFPAAASATIRFDGRKSDAQVVNISLSGCAVRASSLPPRGSVGELHIAGLPPMKFAPCWSRDELAGLAFIERLGFADLASWLVKPAQRFALEGGKVPEGHAP